MLDTLQSLSLWQSKVNSTLPMLTASPVQGREATTTATNCTSTKCKYPKWKDVIPKATTVAPVALGVVFASLAAMALAAAVFFLYFYSGWRQLRKGKRPGRTSYVDQANYAQETYVAKFQHKPAVPGILPKEVSDLSSHTSRRHYRLSRDEGKGEKRSREKREEVSRHPPEASDDRRVTNGGGGEKKDKPRISGKNAAETVDVKGRRKAS